MGPLGFLPSDPSVEYRLVLLESPDPVILFRQIPGLRKSGQCPVKVPEIRDLQGFRNILHYLSKGVKILPGCLDLGYGVVEGLSVPLHLGSAWFLRILFLSLSQRLTSPLRRRLLLPTSLRRGSWSRSTESKMRWSCSSFRRFRIRSAVVLDHFHCQSVGREFRYLEDLSFLVQVKHERINHSRFALRHQSDHPGDNIVDEDSLVYRSVSQECPKYGVSDRHRHPGRLFRIQDRNQEFQDLFGPEVIAVTYCVSVLGVHGFAELSDNILVGP